MSPSNKSFQLKDRKGPVVVFFLTFVLLNLMLMSIYITTYFFCPRSLWIVLFFQCLGLHISSPMIAKTAVDPVGGTFYSHKIIAEQTKIINNVKVKDEDLPWVAIVIPVYNDFMPKEIEFCFKQNYPKIKRYILDDSTDKEMAKEIEVFAKKHNVKILHSKEWRSDYYKKNGLSRAFDYFINQTKGEWDYMIHVDSGDILMHDHAINAVKLFLSNKINNLGSICISYRAVKLNNKVQNFFGLLTDNTNFPSCLFSSLYCEFQMPGAGIVYKAEAIYSQKEWPNTQCEDGAMSNCLVASGYKNVWLGTTTYGERQTLSLVAFCIRNYRLACGGYLMLKDGYLKLNPNKKMGTFFHMLSRYADVFQPFLCVTFFLCPILLCCLKLDLEDFHFDKVYVILTSCFCVIGYVVGYFTTFCISIFLLIRRKNYFAIPFASIVLSPLMPFIYTFAFFSVFIFNGGKKFIVTDKKMSPRKKGIAFFWFIFGMFVIITILLIFGSIYIPFYSVVSLSCFVGFLGMLAVQLGCLSAFAATAFKKQDNSYPNNKIQLID